MPGGGARKGRTARLLAGEGARHRGDLVVEGGDGGGADGEDEEEGRGHGAEEVREEFVLPRRRPHRRAAEDLRGRTTILKNFIGNLL